MKINIKYINFKKNIKMSKILLNLSEDNIYKIDLIKINNNLKNRSIAAEYLLNFIDNDFIEKISVKNKIAHDL